MMSTSDSSTKTTEVATFAAGCFWGVESAFRQMPGVIDAISGYTGGHTAGPSYRDVCSGRTGHAEAVEITFDPTIVSYQTLVDTLFALHDPTTLNRQGPDVGSQYRSAIFVHSPEQRAIAEAAKAAAAPKFRRPIVTEITDATTFYPAEDYHQRYFEKNGVAACHLPNVSAKA